MTVDEMSAEFDILYNNIMSNAAPGLNEYEKSVFLTKAQSEVLKNYFNPKGNKYQEGFDGNQKRQIDFSSLIVTRNLQYDQFNGPNIDSRGLVYILPNDLLTVINESYVDLNGIRYSVIPLSFKDYEKLLCKPYAYPPKKILWRLIGSTAVAKTNEVSYVCPYKVSDTNANDYLVTRFKNKTTKTVNLTIIFDKALSGDGNKPVIEDKGNHVDILAVVPTFKTYSSKYWSNYLQSKPFTDYVEIPQIEKDASPYKYNELFPTLDSTHDAIVRENVWNIHIPYTGEVLGNYVELIGRITGYVLYGTYMVRYVKKPNPIILVDLDVDDHTVSIEGQTAVSACELPEEIQPEVVLRAVELAKAAYAGDLNSQIEMGKRSE